METTEMKIARLARDCDAFRTSAEDKQAVLDIVRTQRNEARDAVARLADMLARAQTERDDARQLLEVAKAQVTSEAQKNAILTTACSDAMAQAAQLREQLAAVPKPGALFLELRTRVEAMELRWANQDDSRRRFRAMHARS